MWDTLKPEFLARIPRSLKISADWEACLAKLNHYRTYTDDWDGQGAILGKPAAPITEEVVESAAALMRSLQSHAVPAPNFTYPGVNGTVGVLWDTAGGGRVEIEVLGPGAADVYFTAADGTIDYSILTDETVAA